MNPAEREALADMLEPGLKPYRDTYPRYSRLPLKGRGREDILSEMHEINRLEHVRWEDGFASGAVYHGDPGHIDFLNEVYALNSQANPLHADLWPSTTKYEAEIVAMVAAMLHGGPAADAAGAAGPPASSPDACGTVSSGGTESILLAMKTYRDRARASSGVVQPNMVVPVTAHAAFDKASQFFAIEARKVPVGDDMRADVAAAAGLVDDNTVVIAGSAVQFPHGVIDPIEELAAIAEARGIGFHTDACLGGFVLPWAERLGYPVPPFDFRVPGVTSMSCDTHKFGYAAKGTSCVLYRDRDLRAYQYYRTAEWPGGLYFSPTLAGSRPGALSAQAWAALVSIGEEGFLDATRRILATAAAIKSGIESVAGLRILGDPLWVIAFALDDEAASAGLNIYDVLDAMSRKGWSLNGLQSPPAVHLCVTLRHTQPDVAERFVADLASAVEQVRAAPAAGGMMAPVYGLASSVEGRGAVEDILRTYLDVLFRV
jgi:sphinganine-1-phosphate aldolase